MIPKSNQQNSVYSEKHCFYSCPLYYWVGPKVHSNFSINILWKCPKELFGQPNTSTHKNTHFYTLCCGLNCVPNKEKLNSNFRYLWMWSYVDVGSLLLLFSPQLYLILCNPIDYSMPGFPSASPRVCSNSHPLTQWSHATIYSSVTPFSSCSQPFPVSRSSPMSQLFTTGGQSTGALASASVLPMNIQGGFPLGLTGLISLLSKGLSRVFTSTTVQSHQFFRALPFLLSSSHICIWLLEKP